MRVQRTTTNQQALRKLPEVYAFTWPDARSGVLPAQWQPISSSAQLQLEFGEPKRYGLNGIIIWGTSTDAGVYLHPESAAIARCREVGAYINNTLGPFLHKLVRVGHNEAS